MLSELEEETQEALSEHKREQQHKEGEAGPGSGSANLEGPALPALRKLTIDGNIPQWVDGPKKTGGDGTDSDNRGMKSAGDGTIVEGGTLQLNVQELGQEQQLTLHKHEAQEAFS